MQMRKTEEKPVRLYRFFFFKPVVNGIFKCQRLYALPP